MDMAKERGNANGFGGITSEDGRPIANILRFKREQSWRARGMGNEKVETINNRFY
jgi:hypothetical protein